MEFGSKFALVEEEGEFEDIFEEELTKAKDDEIDFFEEEGEEDVDDGKTCHVELLDTAGQEEYSALRDTYYTSCQGYLLVYSVDDKESFSDAMEIYQQLLKIQNNPIVCFVGNKCDLKDDIAVKKGDGQAIADKFGWKFYHTSAKTGENVNLAIETLVKDIPRDGSKYKIAVIGPGGVGKSAITMRFMRGEFVDEYDPTIEDTFNKIITLDGIVKREEIIQEEKIEEKKGKELKKKPKKLKKGKKEKKKSGGGFFQKLFGGGRKSRAVTTPVRSLKKKKKRRKKEKIKKIMNERKANTNIIALNLGSVGEEVKTLSTEKPIFCKKCEGAVNKWCSITEDKKCWICNFCGEKNEVHSEKFALPEEEIIEYQISGAPQVYKDDVYMIFVMDISGSMCVSSEIPRGFGMVQIGNREFLEQKKMIDELNKTLPQDEKIQMPNMSRSRYVSRLQCCQSSIDILLDELQKQHPDRKIILMTFNNNIRIYAHDGKTIEVSDKNVLNDFDALYKIGQKYNSASHKTLSDQKTVAKLKKQIAGLKEVGQTAFCPSIVIALGIASNKKQSEVFCCTDGVSNIGVGKVEESPMSHEERISVMELTFTNQEHLKDLFSISEKKGFPFGDIAVHCEIYDGATEKFESQRLRFFNQLSEVAMANDTIISAIGINDEEDCDFEMIEMIVNRSSGQLNICTPLELQRKMRQILDQEKIAKDVKVKVFCDNDFEFVKNDDETLNEKVNENKLEVNMHAIHENTDITTEYVPKKRKDKKKMKTRIPFQSQIHYTKLDGSKFVRIISKQQDVTRKRSDAEKKSNIAVLSSHNIKKATRWGKKGRIREAKMNLRKVSKLQKRSTSRAVDYNDMEDEMMLCEQKMESVNWLESAKTVEEQLNFMESDEESDSDEKGRSKTSSFSLGRRKGRKKKKMKDKTRAVFFNMEQESFSKFKSGGSKKISGRRKHLGKYKK